MNPQARCRPNTHVSWNFIEGRAVVVDPQEGKVFRFNEVGSHIWKAVAESSTVEGILLDVARSFDGPEKKMRNEALRFLKHLQSDDLITL